MLPLLFILFVLVVDVSGLIPVLQTRNVQNACHELSGMFGNGVTPANSGTNYTTEREKNWSEACWLFPSCVVNPGNAQDVSKILGVLKRQKATFATRSGGHSTNPGWANINNGVLLDLGNLNEISFALPEDRHTVNVGVGNRWQEVYDFLNDFELTVNGGHVGDVGVGGLVLGGGLSFLSGLYGFTCDQVASFEVVLSDGSIVNANARNNRDLFFALKGGSSNFGIVTSIELFTKPSETLWYKLDTFNSSDCPELLERLVQFQATAAESFPELSIQLIVRNGECLLAEMSDAARTDQNTEAFKAFEGVIPASQQLFPNITHAGLAEFQSTIPFDGARRTFRSWASLPDTELYLSTMELWQGAVADLTGIAILQYNPQFITTNMVQVGKKMGGNALGLKEVPQTWHQLGAFWNDTADDERISKALSKIQLASSKMARDRGIDLPFIYLNDAASDQNVLESYGSANVDKLNQVSEAYNSVPLFRDLMPGGFKIPKN